MGSIDTRDNKVAAPAVRRRRCFFHVEVESSACVDGSGGIWRLALGVGLFRVSSWGEQSISNQRNMHPEHPFYAPYVNRTIQHPENDTSPYYLNPTFENVVHLAREVHTRHLRKSLS